MYAKIMVGTPVANDRSICVFPAPGTASTLKRLHPLSSCVVTTPSIFLHRLIQIGTMSNFDAKFGPPPVSKMDDLTVLMIQFVCIFVVSCITHPSFLNTPNSSKLSLPLTLIFSIASVLVTIVATRSFKVEY